MYRKWAFFIIQNCFYAKKYFDQHGLIDVGIRNKNKRSSVKIVEIHLNNEIDWKMRVNFRIHAVRKFIIAFNVPCVSTCNTLRYHAF